MDKIVETLEKLTQSAENVGEAMLVLPHKVELHEMLKDLHQKDKEIEKLETMVKKSIENHNSILKDEYKKSSEVIKRAQLKMMYLIQQIETSKQDQQEHVQSELSPGVETGGTSSRMNLADYVSSPMIRKRTKAKLQFTDFEAEITDEDFARIPSYMKGRVSLSELQNFLDEIIRTFNDKYQVLYKNRSALKTAELNLQIMFKDQSSFFEGQKFITVGDIARVLDKNVDKKVEKCLQMLRHIQIIREARKNSITAYIWLKRF